MMKQYALIGLCVVLGFCCKKEPPASLPKPDTGKRDYVWSIDSVYYGNLPGPIKLQNIWGSSARDVWGVNGDSPDVRDCLWHYDGTRWTRATAGTPITEGTGNRVVYDVWGTAGNNVWAVGRRFNRDSLSAFIMHFDGSRWRDATPPNVGQLSNVLYSIYGIAANDFWVYGYEYAIHFNGAQWRPYKVADSMIVVSMDRQQEFLFASTGSPWGLPWGFLHSLGSGGFAKVDSTTTTANKFGLLFCINKSRMVTFSNGIITNQINEGGSIDPNAWSRELSTTTFFRAVFRQRESNLFATGQWNLLYHYNGLEWKRIMISVPNHEVNPQALFGRAWSDANEVFLSDYDNGIVYHGK
jgi:hypothetical protein